MSVYTGNGPPPQDRTTARAVIHLSIMRDRTSSSDSEPRVVRFPGGRAAARRPATVPSPVNDLTKFERGEGTDEYRHRMTVNIAAFVVVLALIGAGFWLATTMAQMRKNQDCVLSGRRGCTPVEVTKGRW